MTNREVITQEDINHLNEVMTWHRCIIGGSNVGNYEKLTEVDEWVKSNINGRYDGALFIYYFEDLEDATMFKLRWL